MNTTNPYAPPQANVQDLADSDAPPLAGRGIRFLTVILDTIILGVLFYAPLIISMRMAGHPMFVNAHFNYYGTVSGGAWMPLIGLGIWLWLTILFVARNGQSIGKKIMGIKVVRKDGSKAEFWRIFLLRNLLNGLLGLIPLYGLIDALVIFSENRQCLHDKIADTIVVNA